jgi:hypothetical protein
MSKNTDNKKNKEQKADAGVGPSKCRFDSCKASPTKFGFCQEHFSMYMAGVIRGDGSKPVDFEKKMELYLKNSKAA